MSIKTLLVCAFGLFFISVAICLFIYKHPDKSRNKNFMGSEVFWRFVLEVGIVLLGAILAIIFTRFNDGFNAEKRVLNALSIVHLDLESQGNDLDTIIDKYKSNQIDVDMLRLNAMVEIRLLEDILFSEDILAIVQDGRLPKSAYSSLLSFYRNIGNYNAYLASSRTASKDYICEMCEDLSRYVHYLVEELIELEKWKKKKEIGPNDFILWIQNNKNKWMNIA